MNITLLKKSVAGKLGWVTRSNNDCEETLKLRPVPHEILKRKVDILKSRWEIYETA